jgi:hypothetical protein
MLPTEKTEKKTAFSNRKILLYGRPKIGKTSLVAALSDKIVFAAFERGHDDVSAYVENIESWPRFLEFTKEVAKSDKFSMMCVDTLDAAYITFHQWYLTSKGVAYEGDLPYGRGFSDLRRQFRDAFFNLQSSGKGFILIGHQCEELLGDSGRVIIRPNYPRDKKNTIKGTIEGMVDAIWYMTDKDIAVPDAGEVVSQRIIRCAGDKMTECGTRFPMPKEVVLVNDDVEASAKALIAEYRRFNKEPKEPKEPKENKEEIPNVET